ncbi:DUF4145 domain-containing protein [Pseudomonas syringae]|uniref:DUF4145 domain-containing protein n=1 Tax=Pseudomonas syringae TaxID=317 RepID=UPI001F0E1D46|nr:DUF4145 domain-containing protein [Pseudomonas syringae]MCH5508858.1 DUF4145 domain-containing protein [Pseudomonas syringae pv. syringae]MCH5637639.1 DUF4145 domain-containing protein [Pseudomonas syringae pv. syringae]MCH7426772.1 DUF4145 domain-containing protein [Pseudomonas syringae pv. syringae]
MDGVTFSHGNTTTLKRRLICEVCKISQKHIVLTSVRKKDEYDTITSITEYEVVQCDNCNDISFRKESSNSEEYYYDPELDEHVFQLDVSVYPYRTAGRFKLKGVNILPIKVKAAYEELIQALNGGQKILAGLGVRVLIEMICKDKKAEGVNLYKKIDNLVSLGVLTPSGSDILHKLRSMGNDSAHEAHVSSADQLSLAMDVVDNLLDSVYVHPKLAVSVFPKDKS